MISTPTPMPTIPISPDAINQANQNLIAFLFATVDEFKIAFAIIGILVVAILSIAYVRKRKNRLV
jgi:LPXTG-motif cell wall-anchored protein